MTAIFLVAFTALAVLNILLLLTAFTGTLKLWPAPSRRSWQSYTFWPLFRTGLGLTIAYGAAQILTAPPGGQMAAGLPLALAGLAATIYGYFDLGLDNTYGSGEGLVTSGLYRYSRNPQYVASIAGFAGLAIAAASVEAALLCGLAIAVYWLLPLAEEPWLARIHGPAYERYMSETPRFLNFGKLLDRLATAQR